MRTRTNRRVYLKRAAVTGALVSVAGCTNPLSGTSYKAAIGLPTPQSGPLAPSGTAGLRGAEVAIEEVNAERDDPIELVDQDGQASPEEARSVVQTMIDDDIPVITGTFSSDVSNAVSELAEQEQVPFMTAISVDPGITSDQDDYTFRLTGDTNQKLTGVAQFLQSQDVGSIGIIGADYSMGRSAVEFMNGNASEYGFSVEHEALVPISTNNFVPEFRNVDTEATDAMFFPFPGGNGPTLIEQARSQGVFDQVDLVIGHDSYGTEMYKSALGEDISGIHNWGVDLSNDRATSATETMQEKFDVPMDALSLPNYDAVHMIAEAMESADSLEPQAIRDELAGMSYSAASGWDVSFSEAGDNKEYRMLVNEWVQQGDSIRNEVQFTSDVISP
ncbi:ABC transporter substrate-binding protein [Natrinema gelatinilyticum]|uniref:ABC transporter substrate-binding protein n=1 Tax=Natrinema gelatinilyticum TaxID=2961571 RepID=UPI0020C1EE48|nr:ABC transporter substrate-binding protein [Natrinema gelatinilyticum]